jgi:Ca-activated chloride channel family protein
MTMTTMPLAPQIEALRDPKLQRFAVWGAAGCLAGALLGQILLAATRSHVVANRQAVCLLIDCSGSMLYGGSGKEGGVGQKLHEVKAAAAAFVSRHRTPADRIAVIGFGKTVHRAAPLTDDAQRLQTAIEGLFDGGTTAMDLGLQAAAGQLGELPDDWRDGDVTRSILLFTDGKPDDGPATLAAAQKCRSSGMRIVAIGTGDAETDFLAQVTGDRKLVFSVDSGDFDEGFRQAEKAIYGGSLVEAGGSRQGFLSNLLRTAAWGLLAACGMSLALVAGQNRYLHRVALNGREAIVAALGGAVAGFCGAAAGQILYSVAAASANLPVLGALAPVTMPVGRLVGWTLMGLLAGWGLSWFVPNLAATRAALGGAIGGAVGGLAFLLALVVGDFIGALLGAAILGAAIGIMLAWVEAAFRQAWLEVHYGGKEVITVSLGAQPVKVGSDNRACQVYARGARPLACQFTFADGHVTCVDFATEKSTAIEIGHEQDIGGVRVVVRGSRAHTDGVASPIQPAHAPPPGPKVAKPSAAAPPDAIAPDAKAPARTLTAPPPRKSSAATSPSPSSATTPPSSGTRVIRPVPPPPPHKKE